MKIEISISEFDSGSGSHRLFRLVRQSPFELAACRVRREFWSGCAAADGVVRNISIHFKSDETDYFRVTRVDLVEYTAPAIDYDPKGHSPGNLPGRPHPVVVELRETRRQLLTGLRGILISLGLS